MGRTVDSIIESFESGLSKIERILGHTRMVNIDFRVKEGTDIEVQEFIKADPYVNGGIIVLKGVEEESLLRLENPGFQFEFREMVGKWLVDYTALYDVDFTPKLQYPYTLNEEIGVCRTTFQSDETSEELILNVKPKLMTLYYKGADRLKMVASSSSPRDYAFFLYSRIEIEKGNRVIRSLADTLITEI
ncbi:hypothetical protein [Sanyastnella coralliicola]|uniref:hypothetical protein n=1 Tax=Sanyastnella coralliicola TaxID=3069118 RepID=UPI0027BB1847|nr:hypothetical protein [Longitalea sp. SCSIO 12813]